MVLLSSQYWEIKETENKGRGLFAKKAISPGVVIGDYIGKVLRTKEVDLDEDKENLYLMYYHDRACIFPNLQKPGIHLLNHSCSPNSGLYTYCGHTLAFTLRQIFAGEELTISYLLTPKDEFCKSCNHVCKCESMVCRQTMHQSLEKYKKWRIFQETKAKKDPSTSSGRGKIRYGKELPQLSRYPKTIPDNSIYDLFGNTQKPPKSFAAKTLPSVKEIRKLIRKTGRVLKFPALNTKIYGILNDLVISETSSKNKAILIH